VSVDIRIGDCRELLRAMPDESVHCVVTSPPYFGLRDYGVAGQIGLEPTPDAFVAEMVAVFREVRRVLRGDGTLFLNLGDSYAGYWGEKYAHKPFGKDREPDASTPPHKRSPDFKQWRLKPKDLIGIPWRVAFALQADGWYLRSEIVWSKPNPMPESVTDRPTSAHEKIFLFAKSARYFYDAAAVREAGRGGGRFNGSVDYAAGDRNDAGRRDVAVAEDRNLRNVWTVPSQPFADAHFATFPPALIEPCIKAGCPVGGTVLDPFGGAGTTGLVADRLGRDAILVELNPTYAEMARRRIAGDAGMFADVSAA